MAKTATETVGEETVGDTAAPPAIETYVLWQRPGIAGRPMAAAWCAAKGYTSGYRVAEAGLAGHVILVGAADFYPAEPLPETCVVSRVVPCSTDDPDDLENALFTLRVLGHEPVVVTGDARVGGMHAQPPGGEWALPPETPAEGQGGAV